MLTLFSSFLHSYMYEHHHQGVYLYTKVTKSVMVKYADLQMSQYDWKIKISHGIVQQVGYNS
jgi:hypothetical protein